MTNSKVTSQATSTSNTFPSVFSNWYYISTQVLYTYISILDNQIKYYLVIKEGISTDTVWLLQVFYRFTISYDGLLLKIAYTKNSRKLMPRT